MTLGIDPVLFIGMLAIFIMVIIPVYNFFAGRAAAKKAENDMFHARINRLVEDVQFIKGWLKGKFNVDSD